MQLWALVIVVVAWWQASDVPGFAFVDHDDGINIVVNPHLGPPSAEMAAWAFTDTTAMRRYVPLGWLGFSAVYEFSGLSPRGYHVAGVALHMVNSVLVFAVLLAGLRRFGASVASDNWRMGCAALGALLWSVHPFRAEVIGWASGLLYGQAGFFALLSVLAYLRMWRGGGGRIAWLAAAALLYTASMLTYPVSLGLVGVFLCLDFLAVRQGASVSVKRIVLEKLALAIPAVAVLAVTVMANQRASDFWGARTSWAEFGLVARLQQAAEVWVYFLWKPWWPAELTPVPTWLIGTEARASLAWAAPIVVGGISGLLIARWKTWSAATALWFAHAALLAPMLGLNERPHFASDRYHYLAGMVLVAAIAGVASQATGRGRALVTVGGAAAALMLALAQREQLGIWTSTDALMTRIVARAEHPAVRDDYALRWARFHANRGAMDRALAVAERHGIAWERVAEPTPGGVPLAAGVHLKLALEFRRAGRVRPAREHFQAASAIAPTWAEAAYRRALFHLEEGEVDEAWNWCRRASARGIGAEVPLAARRQLGAAIAEGFSATQRPVLAREVQAWSQLEAARGGAP